MNLTIAELAVAVDRSETYVRQHIHRKHLAVVRERRHVKVELGEARRWAQKRGLPFKSPIRIATEITATQDRTARLTVLAWKTPDGGLRNLFTLLRHRREDEMGPWAGKLDSDWHIEELSGELLLLSVDGSLNHCEPVIDRILDSGTLEVKGNEIGYELESIPRRHWAYRDRRKARDDSMLSPFKRHSAAILEYWSFAPQPRKWWRVPSESSVNAGRSRWQRLGFPLEHRSDRVGNLMIASAEDAISCDLVAHHDRTLTFLAEADDRTVGSHCGMVWADHSGDEVLRRWIEIAPGETRIPLESDVDSVGFAIFRAVDGQCVDLMSERLMMESSVRRKVQIGPTLHLRNQERRISHDVNPFHDVSTVTVRADEHSPELDKGIRGQWLDFLSHRRDSSARRRGDLVRFGSGKWNQAVSHLCGIIAADNSPPNPIYIADPYFMDSATNPAEMKLWLDVFASTAGSPLRILCGKARASRGLPRWWSNCPNQVTSHVRARIFTKPRGPAFHDRYLITPTREVLITHSANGWDADGVTFVSLPYGVYRAEAERLWSMNIGSSAAGVNVEELC